MIYTVTFNPAIDYVVRTDGPFVPGQVNRSAQEDYQFGGKGINVSLMLARLDCPSVALGFVAGATGSWLEQGLQAQGLHSDWIHLPGGMTRINVKIKAQTESELNGRGPDITPEAMEQLYAKLDALREGDILVLAGSLPGGLPSDTYRRILDRLAGRGIRAAVDTAGEALAAVLPARPFLIKPNHCELTALAGRPLTTQTEIEAAARDLQQQGARNVLVSMAAGLSIARLQEMLGFAAPILRIMPNTPAAIGRGMLALSAEAGTPEARIQAVEAMVRSGELLDLAEALVPELQ